MYSYCSFLRGINVGGHRPMPMARLASVYARCGCADVRTHLVSGNVVFRHASKNAEALARRIMEAIHSEFGFSALLNVIPERELQAILEEFPFGNRKTLDGSRTFVAFPLGDGVLKNLPVAYPKDKKDELRIGTRALYMVCPAGAGKTRLTNAFLEKAFGREFTTRNWNTVTAIAAVLGRHSS